MVCKPIHDSVQLVRAKVTRMHVRKAKQSEYVNSSASSSWDELLSSSKVAAIPTLSK